MKFERISVTKKGVSLTHQTKSPSGATEDVVLKSPERPYKSFEDAMQGFAPYVASLLGGILSESAEKALSITTLNFSEDKNGLRGMIVTAVIPVENADDKPLVLNTPLVREAGELALDDDRFVLSEEVLDLVGVIEKEATAYAGGKRRKPEAEPETSENAKEFNVRAAAAESATTRKPKGKSVGKSKSVGKANGKSAEWADPVPPKPDADGVLTIQQGARLG